VKRTYSETVEPLKFKASKKRKTATTLQKKPDGPFPRSKTVNLVYENALTNVAPAAAFVALGLNQTVPMTMIIVQVLLLEINSRCIMIHC